MLFHLLVRSTHTPNVFSSGPHFPSLLTAQKCNILWKFETASAEERITEDIKMMHCVTMKRGCKLGFIFLASNSHTQYNRCVKLWVFVLIHAFPLNSSCHIPTHTEIRTRVLCYNNCFSLAVTNKNVCSQWWFHVFLNRTFFRGQNPCVNCL